MRLVLLALLVALSVPQGLWAVPKGPGATFIPPTTSSVPPHVQRVQPAVVGIKVRVPLDRPSVRTLGPERWGSGVIFDPAGYAVTVSYVLLDAEIIQVSLRDGRVVPAKLAGLDLEHGLGVIRLEGDGPWPAAALGDSSKVSVGQPTATIGVDDDNDLVVTQGSVQEIRRFAGYWEYMIDRAFGPLQSRLRWEPAGEHPRGDHRNHQPPDRGPPFRQSRHPDRALHRVQGRTDQQGTSAEPSAAPLAFHFK